MPKTSATRSTVSLDDTVATFAKAIALARSFTHPSRAERFGRLWVIRDEPRRKSADYRREEWVACGVEAADVDREARKHSRGHFCVCAVRGHDESAVSLRAGYKQLGYRLNVTEPYMLHSLSRIPRCPAKYSITRVTTQDLADRLNRAARVRQVLPEHFGKSSPIRAYLARDGERSIGWVRSIAVGRATWVSNLYVVPEYRRHGLGKALMASLLRDDRAHKSRYSLLSASHTGALLYPQIGYELIGEFFVYTPTKHSC